MLNLTFAANYAWTGRQAWSYHVVNLAIHILAGLTLFGVVRRTLERMHWGRAGPPARPGLPQAQPHRTTPPAGEAAPACPPEPWRRREAQPYLEPQTWAALAFALLWTVHPLQTISITYVSQRAESLMGLFYLLTLYCFIRYTSEVGRTVLGEPGTQKTPSSAKAWQGFRYNCSRRPSP